MCMMQGHIAPPEILGKAAERTIERVLAHAGATIENQNETLVSEALRNTVLAQFTDYIWMDRDGTGICTACGNEVDERTFIHSHKAWVRCPECGRAVQVRELRYGHRKLHEEFYAVEWRRSAIEPGALVMVGVYCGFDCRGDAPQREQKVICPVLVDVFRYGKSAERFQRSVWGWRDREPGHEPWVRRREVRALGGSYFGRRVDVVVSDDNFREALKGTPFASAMQTLSDARMECGIRRTGDHSEDIAAIAKRPWIEYMIKAGFRRIGIDAVYSLSRGTINERRRTVREILKLTPDRYAALKGCKADVSVDELRVIQRADADGCMLKLEEARKIGQNIGGWHGVENLLGVYGKLDRALVRFLQKCSYDRWRTLYDYLYAAREVGADMSVPGARLPQNLEEAHDRMVALRNETQHLRMRAKKEQECEGLQGKLDKRLPELERKYCFEFDGLVLRPARRLIELIDEGNALSHCVGGYAGSYAEGRTDICFLRHADEPDKPWRTIEFNPNTGRLIQDRGYGNDRATGNNDKGRMDDALRARLGAFWAAFEQNRKTKGRKTA